MFGIVIISFNMPILDKRKGDDILALVPASKRTKNEVVFSSREKAVVQSVSITLKFSFRKLVIFL